MKSAREILEGGRWQPARRRACAARALAMTFAPFERRARASFPVFGRNGGVLDPRTLTDEQRDVVAFVSGEGFWLDHLDEDDDDAPPLDFGIPPRLLARRMWLGLEETVSCEARFDGEPLWSVVQGKDVARVRKLVASLDPVGELAIFLEGVVGGVLGPAPSAIERTPAAIVERARAFDAARAEGVVDRIVTMHLALLENEPAHDVDAGHLDAILAAERGEWVSARVEPLLRAARLPTPHGQLRGFLGKVDPARREAFLLAMIDDTLRRAPPAEMGFGARTRRAHVVAQLAPLLGDYPTSAFAQRLVRMTALASGYLTLWEGVRASAGHLPAVADALDRLDRLAPRGGKSMSEIFARYPVD